MNEIRPSDPPSNPEEVDADMVGESSPSPQPEQIPPPAGETGTPEAPEPPQDQEQTPPSPPAENSPETFDRPQQESEGGVPDDSIDNALNTFEAAVKGVGNTAQPPPQESQAEAEPEAAASEQQASADQQFGIRINQSLKGIPDVPLSSLPETQSEPTDEQPPDDKAETETPPSPDETKAEAPSLEEPAADELPAGELENITRSLEEIITSGGDPLAHIPDGPTLQDLNNLTANNFLYRQRTQQLGERLKVAREQIRSLNRSGSQVEELQASLQNAQSAYTYRRNLAGQRKQQLSRLRKQLETSQPSSGQEPSQPLVPSEQEPTSSPTAEPSTAGEAPDQSEGEQEPASDEENTSEEAVGSENDAELPDQLSKAQEQTPTRELPPIELSELDREVIAAMIEGDQRLEGIELKASRAAEYLQNLRKDAGLTQHKTPITQIAENTRNDYQWLSSLIEEAKGKVNEEKLDGIYTLMREVKGVLDESELLIREIESSSQLDDAEVPAEPPTSIENGSQEGGNDDDDEVERLQGQKLEGGDEGNPTPTPVSSDDTQPITPARPQRAERDKQPGKPPPIPADEPTSVTPDYAQVLNRINEINPKPERGQNEQSFFERVQSALRILFKGDNGH